MHKIIIQISSRADQQRVDDYWHLFLHQAEDMPGLLKETASEVEAYLYGAEVVTRIHEFYFRDFSAVRDAMRSKAGVNAGKILQDITRGNVSVFIAEHREDQLEQIQRFRSQSEDK